MPEDRAEHLAWCKERALEYVDRGDLVNASSSFISDMAKHPETKAYMDNLSLLFSAEITAAVMTNSPRRLRDLIEGCR